MKHRIQFILIQILLFPFAFLPLKWIQFIGKKLGTLCFYLLKNYRKRTLSNLALAFEHNAIYDIAKEAFQNLLITCLEYPKLAFKKDIISFYECKNPHLLEPFIQKKQGLVLFCGHQANWEIMFLEATRRMPGVGIAKAMRNPFLDKWLTKIRGKYGGKMITPRNALREGIKAINEGKFIGIVGDQGMPESNFASPFFGKRAFSSPIPAIWAYKAKCPLMAVTAKRANGKYVIEYSNPIWPDPAQSLGEEISRLMQYTLGILEASIRKNPGQWLWQHNRWKQQTPKMLYYRFRRDPILIVFPEEEEEFQALLPLYSTFKAIYPKMFLTFLLPQKFAHLVKEDIIAYENRKKMLLQDYRFKLVFNLANYPEIKKHFLKLSAFEVLNIPDLKKIAATYSHLKEVPSNLSELLKMTLLRVSAHKLF